MQSYVVVGAVAAGATWAVTWLVRCLAPRAGMVVAPDERRVHNQPLTTAGGIAMFVAFLAAMAVAWRLPALHELFDGTSEPLGVVLGAAIIFAVGLLDDVRDMSAPAKVAGQVLGASVMAINGVQMLYFRVPFWNTVVLSSDIGFLLTIIWVVLVTNAVNLIDGLDGLAAGVVGIAGLAFFAYSTRQVHVGLLLGTNLGPLMAVIVVGVCIGFLPHNFHPARIIMGDAGALFIGLLLAVSTLEVGGRTGDDFSGQTFFFFAPIAIPFIILGVPLLDTAFAVVRRVSRRSGWSVADKEHLHHRLMRLGHGHRRAVLILWMWTGVLASLVLLPLKVSSTNALVLPGVLALAVLLFTVFRPEMRRSAVVAAAEAEDAVVAATRAADTVDVAESVLGHPDVPPGSDHRNGHRARRHALRRRREAEAVADP